MLDSSCKMGVLGKKVGTGGWKCATPSHANPCNLLIFSKMSDGKILPVSERLQNCKQKTPHLRP